MKDIIQHFKFIGGPWDGEYHETDGRDYIDVRKPSTLRPIRIEPDGTEDHAYDGAFEPMDITRYTLRCFAAGKEGEFSVWYYADAKWSDVRVVSQLVHHYPGRP